MNQSTIDAILDGPAMAPPPGVEANFENPENLSHPELAWLQLIVATVVVVMRVYTKLGVVRKMLAEDCKCYHNHGLRMDRRETPANLCSRLVDCSLALLCRLPCHRLHV